MRVLVGQFHARVSDSISDANADFNYQQADEGADCDRQESAKNEL
jgi:hypothetical protein